MEKRTNGAAAGDAQGMFGTLSVNTADMSISHNYLTCAISDVTRDYFQFVISNSNATARACVMHWTAAPV